MSLPPLSRTPVRSDSRVRTRCAGFESLPPHTRTQENADAVLARARAKHTPAPSSEKERKQRSGSQNGARRIRADDTTVSMSAMPSSNKYLSPANMDASVMTRGGMRVTSLSKGFCLNRRSSIFIQQSDKHVDATPSSWQPQQPTTYLCLVHSNCYMNTMPPSASWEVRRSGCVLPLCVLLRRDSLAMKSDGLFCS